MNTRSNLAATNASDAVTAAYTQISAVQDLPAAQQVAGAALLFHSICENLQVSPHELLNKAMRMEKDADTFFQREAKALREYVKGELR